MSADPPEAAEALEPLPLPPRQRRRSELFLSLSSFTRDLPALLLDKGLLSRQRYEEVQAEGGKCSAPELAALGVAWGLCSTAEEFLQQHKREEGMLKALLEARAGGVEVRKPSRRASALGGRTIVGELMQACIPLQQPQQPLPQQPQQPQQQQQQPLEQAAEEEVPAPLPSLAQQPFLERPTVLTSASACATPAPSPSAAPAPAPSAWVEGALQGQVQQLSCTLPHLAHDMSARSAQHTLQAADSYAQLGSSSAGGSRSSTSRLSQRFLRAAGGSAAQEAAAAAAAAPLAPLSLWVASLAGDAALSPSPTARLLPAAAAAAAALPALTSTSLPQQAAAALATLDAMRLTLASADYSLGAEQRPALVVECRQRPEELARQRAEAVEAAGLARKERILNPTRHPLYPGSPSHAAGGAAAHTPTPTSPKPSPSPAAAAASSSPSRPAAKFPPFPEGGPAFLATQLASARAALGAAPAVMPGAEARTFFRAVGLAHVAAAAPPIPEHLLPPPRVWGQHMFTPQAHGIKAGAEGWQLARQRLAALQLAQQHRVKAELVSKAYRAQRVSLPSGAIGGEVVEEEGEGEGGS